jgi:alpha-tubulin suppressor-like RCC1 family protein
MVMESPHPVEALPSGVTAVSALLGSVCAVVTGGAWCWQDLRGDGVPAQVRGLASGVQAIARSSDFSCAVVAGSAWCWGGNSLGQLGNNSTSSSTYPVPVQFP